VHAAAASLRLVSRRKVGDGQRIVSTIYTTLQQYHVILEVDPKLQYGPDALSRIYINSAGDDTGVVERPSENRMKEALALDDVTRFVVACPKDTVMYTAAVQALGAQDRIKVCDIVDLIELVDPSIQSAGL
jgi:hypothetical protein